MIRAKLFAALLALSQAAAGQTASDVGTLLRSGVEAENRGDLDLAIADFRRAADLTPSSPLAFLKLGNAYMQERNYGAAIPPLKRAAELDPNSAPVQQLLGYSLLAQGYASEAIPHLQIAKDSAALGIAELETDQSEKAVVHLQDALAKHPDDPDLLFYLSRAGSALAEESKDKLLAEFPDSARGHQLLGQSYYAAKIFPDAKAEYERAIAMRPDLPTLHLELGEIYAANSEWTKAEEQFRIASKLQPGNAEVAYRLGDLLLQQGNMKQAAAELRRSDSLRPDMPETLFALGRALRVSEPKKAAEILNRVTQLEKQSSLAAQAYFLLAAINRTSGNAELAAREMQEYRKIENLLSKPRE